MGAYVDRRALVWSNSENPDLDPDSSPKLDREL